ncbi:MAG: ferritin family protein [Nitrospirae bacterium]|nr:ferritin family protein [Nitrospirota bacterium]
MEDITLKEIIDYAKINEDNARQFYLNAAEHAKRDNVKTFLLALAKQEQTHIDRLNELDKIVDKGGRIPKPHGIVKPLGYAEHLGNVTIDADADYQQVLKFAMAREKEALESYQKYAKLVDDKKAKDLFLLLAGEESEHLRGFENQYDDFMKEIENW